MENETATAAEDWQRRATEAENFLRPYLSAPQGDDPPVTLAGYHGPQIARALASVIGRLEREAVARARQQEPSEGEVNAAATWLAADDSAYASFRDAAERVAREMLRAAAMAHPR